MSFWLKRSDSLILSVVIILAVVAIAHPHLTTFFGQFFSSSDHSGPPDRGVIELEDPKIALPPLIRTPARLNLNSATAKELQSLDGVGPVLSKKIIQLRESRGKFQAVAQLQGVDGIGKSKLSQFEDSVYVPD